jgi:hypothetical protein
LSLVSTQSREKHTAKPLQFDTPIAVLKSFSRCFRFIDYLQRFPRYDLLDVMLELSVPEVLAGEHRTHCLRPS